jgi:23S rRNA pseudouridine2604 synthase
MRINRYLALKGFATRKGADDLVAAGLVSINGRKAVLGDRVAETDAVEVLQKGRRPAKEFVYVAYYKPRGVVTHSPKKGERSIGDISRFPGTFPVGRLDKASEGLMLLTDDGRVTERMLHPRFEHEKEYRVTVRENVLPFVKETLEKGVRSQGERLTAKSVTVTGPHSLTIVLTEGKKHQIRRMLDHVRLTVESLKRVRIMDLHLGSLRQGQSRVLHGRARKAFLESIGLR